MSETEILFAGLRRSADEAVADMLERMVRDAPDHALNKINALDLAAREGLGEDCGAPQRGGARHVRNDMERHVPELRRCSLRQ